MDKNTLATVARGFISGFSDSLDREGLQHFSQALKRVATTTVQRGPVPPLQHSGMQYLDPLVNEIDNPSIRAAAQSLDWGQLYGGGGIDPVLADGMFAAQAAGTYGVFSAQHVATGLFLLAPNVFYPLHTHAAREVYHCVAGQIEICHRLDEAPFTLHANQSSETPSGRLHSLRTNETPVLLAYIWTGELTAPTWWWQQNDSGKWLRTAWRRKPGESWKAEQSEPITEDNFNAALR